jgi:hypothetical protein
MLPEEGMQRFLDQVFELWINPELERRRADGTLADDFALQKAQIIFNIDQAPKVRINEEVKALAHLVVNRRIEKGEEIRHKDIEAISKVELTDEDPDAGHVTLIDFAGAWHLTFDFIYNRTKIREALAAAEEFISVAKFAASEQNFRAFVENAFASAELLSKAFLMRMPNKRILHAKSHDLIFTNLNQHAKLGGSYRVSGWSGGG